MTYEFLKDQERDDAFNWGPARSTLKDAILALPPPGCIAVYGPWGAGKTTFLKHLRKTFVEATTVWFDPWEYERSGDVITPLLHSIFSQLSKSKEIPADWRKKVLKFMARIGKLTMGSAYKAVRFGAGLYGVPLPAIPEELEKLEDLSVEDIKGWFGDEAKNDPVQDIKREFQELVETAMKGKPEQRLVVFLDDLDRCLPDTALSVIEATKLLLCGSPIENDGDAKGAEPRPDKATLPVIFVFALDRQLVGEAIASHYQASTSYTGESYLEKIFDVSIEVPPATEVGLTTLLGSLKQLQLIAAQKADAAFLTKALNQPIFANPRVLMRTVNRLQLLANGIQHVPSGWPRNPAEWVRLVWWMAGAERYRAFRLAFFSATSAEIRLLHFHVNPPTDSSVAELASHALRQIVAMPRFGEFYNLMFSGFTHEQVDRQRRPRSKADDPMTVWEIDAQLRPLGI